MGFQDTFKKASEGEEDLQYDDAAFNFFIFGIIMFIELILIYSIYKHIFKTKKYKKACPCKDCQIKVEKLKEIERKKKFNKTLLIKVKT